MATIVWRLTGNGVGTAGTITPVTVFSSMPMQENRMLKKLIVFAYVVTAAGALTPLLCESDLGTSLGQYPFLGQPDQSQVNVMSAQNNPFGLTFLSTPDTQDGLYGIGPVMFNQAVSSQGYTYTLALYKQGGALWAITDTFNYVIMMEWEV